MENYRMWVWSWPSRQWGRRGRCCCRARSSWRTGRWADSCCWSTGCWGSCWVARCDSDRDWRTSAGACERRRSPTIRTCTTSRTRSSACSSRTSTRTCSSADSRSCSRSSSGADPAGCSSWCNCSRLFDRRSRLCTPSWSAWTTARSESEPTQDLLSIRCRCKQQHISYHLSLLRFHSFM